jgi:hypothetical protein
MPEIVKWAEIRDQFRDGLLLGNGASIAIHDGFKYESLYQAAQSNGHFSQEVIQIFNAFSTTDFELVLRSLWQAQLVNQKLDIESGRVEDAYHEVRKALIATVHECHVSFDDAHPHLPIVYQFMKQFKTVLSLNYDLIVYWAMMAGNEALGPWFKDAFFKNSFRDNWEEVRVPYGKADGATIVVYPHGNLILARNLISEETKLQVASSTDLLNSILRNWEAGGVVPIFVSEGTSAQKQRAIENSSYLQRIYREVIPKVGSTLVIYGWSASKQDKHILNQLKLAGIKKVAISVYHEDDEFIAGVERLFREAGVEDVLFFDAESDGCWMYPASEME